jgi:hypothetical protein
MFDLPDSAILYADSARGIYIPQYFAESIRRDCVSGVTQEEWDILSGEPDSESYWDVWNDVECRAIVTAPDTGIRYRLYQDGDLWLVPADWRPED